MGCIRSGPPSGSLQSDRDQKLALLTGLVVLLLSLPMQAEVSEAAPRNIQFTNLTTEIGFSSEFVNDVVQDGRGFMWFASQSGLNRYDGHEVRVYENEANDPTSLSHNFVWSLHIDPKGDLWVGTERGVNRYDPLSDTFVREPWDDLALANYRVRKVVQDEKGIFWIGTLGSGLLRIDPATGEMKRFSHDPADANSLASNLVIALIIDRRGQLWVGLDGGGLARYDAATENFVSYQTDPGNTISLSDNRVRSLYEGSRGQIWIGTGSGGLNRLDPGTGRFTRFDADPSDPFSLPEGQVLSIFEDTYNTLWVGTDSGLAEWLPDAGGFARYQSDTSRRNSLVNNRVNAITQDKSGVLWLATNGGISLWNHFSDSFTYYNSRNDSLRSDIVTSVAESSEGQLWVGTYGGGLSNIDPLTGTVTHYRHLDSEPDSLPDNQVMSVYIDRQDRLWVGMRTGGLALKLPGQQIFTQYQHDPAQPTSLSGNGVTSILQDRAGGLWVGVFDGGLNYSPTGDPEAFQHYRHDPEAENVISGDRVLRVFQDQSGDIWVGTEGDGLNRLEVESGKITQYDLETTVNDSGRPRGTPWEIYETPDKTLWLGTLGQGLFRWSAGDRAGGLVQFEQISASQGLVSEVYGIVVGSAGELWLSSNRGLFEYDPATQNIRKFDRNNGLLSNEFNQGARLRSRSGRLLFGSNMGLVGFFPGDLPENDQPPNISLTASSRTETIARTWSGDQTPLILLDYFDAFISFDFVALDFVSPDKNAYRYRLAGLDSEWTEVENFRRAIYSSLAPGRYRFEVQAANNDGVWNRTGAAAEVHVVPPPWSTWWAYTIYVIVLLLIVGLYFRSQRAKQQVEAATRVRLERLVTERTAELAERNDDLMTLNDKLEHASVTDALTGLRNRRFVDEHVAAEVSMLQRMQFEDSTGDNEPNAETPRMLFLMMIDLDGFKAINDSFGHQAGDQALLQVKDRLLAACRKSDVVVRWGGDEFLIIGHARSIEGAEQFTEKIRLSLSESSYDLGHGDIGRLAGSIGISPLPFVEGKIDFASWEQICSIADVAAYLAKDTGGNGWVSISGTPLLAQDELVDLKERLSDRVNERKIRVKSSVVLGDFANK